MTIAAAAQRWLLLIDEAVKSQLHEWKHTYRMVHSVRTMIHMIKAAVEIRYHIAAWELF